MESQILVSASSLEFGGVDVGKQDIRTVDVSNTGGSSLLLTVTLPENPSDQYTVDHEGNAVPDQIPGGTTYTLTVTFKPTTDGEAPGTLRIDTTDPVSPRIDVSLTATGEGGSGVDSDEDGVSTGDGDCDDTDPDIYPGAAEPCDGIDNDCDDDVDEEGSSTFYIDEDGDAHGDPDTAFDACKPEGAVTTGDDCDDGDPAVFPGAFEVCDGKDNDCDDALDDGVLETYYRDRDGDGFGDTSTSITGCAAEEGYVALDGDCDDDDPAVFPGADESCDGVDNDCDGEVDPAVELTYYRDADGDGFGDPDDLVTGCTPPDGYVSQSGDCDDADAAVYTGAAEACDGKDNDCDGKTDEDDPQVFYRDADGDSAGDARTTTLACAAPEGYVADSSDCNDADASIYPGADESCDSKDNDCDGKTDEEGQTAYYRDSDGDGHGDPSVSQEGCGSLSGYVSAGDDCNDKDKTVYPGAEESCNGKDDDCDSVVDEDVLPTWYLDADQDGYGSGAVTITACSKPVSYAAEAGDCDDLNANVNPGATEVCDDRDNDCDGATDEDVLETFYADADKDGYGDAKTPTSGCTAPKGSVEDNTDCDDTRSSVYPGATEVCDDRDNDCDVQIDEGVLSTWYRDSDGDTWGSSAATAQACSAPTGYVGRSGDCNDADATAFPQANELCDGTDNDCDGTIDEGVKQTYYSDTDGDKYGDPNTPVQTCEIANGLSTNNLDCDDKEAASYPGAAEKCDSKDNDCDGKVDEAGDTAQNAYYQDVDKDTYGSTTQSTYACSKPTGYVTTSTDCDDLDAATYPGAKELCQGRDNDCDGVAGPPSPPTASNNGPVCVNNTASLSASSITGAIYAWTGPNSFSSSLQNPSISSVSSSNAGTYSVTASLESCPSEPATTTLSVISPNSSYTVSGGYINQPTSFSAVSQTGATYKWTFENGSPSTSTSQTPSVTWSVKGTFAVVLEVTINGCSAKNTSSITITDTAPSCKSIKDSNPSATDGVYTLDPDGSGSGAPFQAYCDMTTDGGGWTLIYYVDAVYFDGWVANNKTANSTAPTKINGQGDMWNPPSGFSYSQSLFVCTTQNDAAKYYWTYNKTDPITWYTNTSTDYQYQQITNTTTNASTATCQSTHKAESGYGFIVLESQSCGSCGNMLFGNYHYTGGSQCNSTSNTYGQHTSPWRSVTLGYPLCNRQQTSNGKFWIGIR